MFTEILLGQYFPQMKMLSQRCAWHEVTQQAMVELKFEMCD